MCIKSNESVEGIITQKDREISDLKKEINYMKMVTALGYMSTSKNKITTPNVLKEFLDEIISESYKIWKFKTTKIFLSKDKSSIFLIDYNSKLLNNNYLCLICLKTNNSTSGETQRYNKAISTNLRKKNKDLGIICHTCTTDSYGTELV